MTLKWSYVLHLLVNGLNPLYPLLSEREKSLFFLFSHVCSQADPVISSRSQQFSQDRSNPLCETETGLHRGEVEPNHHEQVRVSDQYLQ
jgi:hypothetical protein